jgi:C4-dicarboxylate-specific signal transduction histidine kinase
MANGSTSWDMMENCLEEIREAVELVSRVAPASRRRRRTIDVGSELQAFEQATIHLLADYRVRLELEPSNAELLRSDLPPETLQQVLHILLWNSLEWVESEGKGKIRISASGNGDTCRMIFQDNGPGIRTEHADRIFQPHFSLRENGRGMGLTIARHLLSEYGASIRLLHDRRRKGAGFEIRLRLKKSRATRG